MCVPRCHQRNAPSPAVNTNTGAQKCVTQRVRNRIARRRREVGRRRRHRGAMKEVAHVIERHDDHDGAAQGVDRFDASGRRLALLWRRGIA